jgi:hypothetical protein
VKTDDEQIFHILCSYHLGFPSYKIPNARAISEQTKPLQKSLTLKMEIAIVPKR